MQLPDEVTSDVRKRLRRVAGQIEGVERMLAEGRECQEVLTQLAAVSKALDRAGFKLVASGLAYCIEHPEADGGTADARHTLERLFLSLA